MLRITTTQSTTRSDRPAIRLSGQGRRIISSSLIWFASFLRCLPLFFSARPKTPLRFLGVMTFEALHRIRQSKPLPAATHHIMAALLDLGGCMNALFDNKEYRQKEVQRTREILDEAGLHSFVEDFLRRLCELEAKRPSRCGTEWQFHNVQSYREEVIRLLLGSLAAISAGNQSVDEGVQSAHADEDLKTVFRIVMQCQIIDDVVDYSKDSCAGLPSFLTASESLPEAIRLTRQAASSYAAVGALPGAGDILHLRFALFLVSTGAMRMLQLGGWRFVHRRR